MAKITIPPESRFGFDVQQFIAERPTATERAQQIEVPEELLTQQAFSQAVQTAGELAAGKIPEDVVAEIERVSAERGLSRGLGLGQAARFLTARDLGLTSLDIAQRGIQQVAALRGVELQERELGLRTEALKEEIRQWDDKFVVMMQEADVNAQRVQLAATELVTRNQQFHQSLINDLIIQNSRREVPGLQSRIDVLQRQGIPTEEAILQVVGLR